jgi:glutamine amidotransferase
MCRATAYLGPPIAISALLQEPDNGLARQFNPLQHTLLNLAGFGMMAWVDGSGDEFEPLVYRETTVPIYDSNLASLSRKVSASTVLAHVRGIPYAPSVGYGPQNLHPFWYPGTQLALAHNGDLIDFQKMRVALHRYLRPEIAAQLGGTTDSEYVYALLLSQLDDPTEKQTPEQIIEALQAAMKIIRQERAAIGVDTRSSLNLFICDKDLLIAVRFTYDYGRYPLDPSRAEEAALEYLGLWYTAGDRFAIDEGRWRMAGTGGASEAVLVASEPLTNDVTGWVEVPEYTAMIAQKQGNTVSVRLQEIDA